MPKLVILICMFFVVVVVVQRLFLLFIVVLSTVEIFVFTAFSYIGRDERGNLPDGKRSGKGSQRVIIRHSQLPIEIISLGQQD